METAQSSSGQGQKLIYTIHMSCRAKRLGSGEGGSSDYADWSCLVPFTHPAFSLAPITCPLKDTVRQL